MDLTEGTRAEKTARAKKMMLWFGILSLLMAFAGWTSAFIVSSSREDWMDDIELPSAFFVSTAVILLSSGTYIMALKDLLKGAHKRCTLLLLSTLGAGVIFILLQLIGFSQMIGYGYYFTGPSSNITMSYIFIIAAVHIVHVVAGIISLCVVVYNHLRRKYTPEDHLGMDLGATFWHFLGVLWLYLVLFMFFFR